MKHLLIKPIKNNKKRARRVKKLLTRKLRVLLCSFVRLMNVSPFLAKLSFIKANLNLKGGTAIRVRRCG